MSQGRMTLALFFAYFLRFKLFVLPLQQINEKDMRTLHLSTICAALLFFLASAANAIELKDYYANANNKKGAELKTALYGIIHKHTNIGYDGLLSAYHDSDRRADGYLRDWYSNATNYVIGGPKENHSYQGEGDSYNREHLVPQSWFGTGDMKSDLVQVVPSDGYVNNRRGNFPMGENKGETYSSKNKYSKVGACTVSGYSGQCFEPNDEIKGDIARIYFYVLACYENLHPSWTGGTASQFFDGKKYPGLKPWAMNMLLRWARQDPVDNVERARNEVVYEKQKNRNPFVDYPSLCDYVWGDSVSYAFDITLPHGQSQTDLPDNPDNPVDPDDPVNPDDPDNPVNPDAQSGTIVFADLSWTPTSHPTYGEGFTATANGLTISYYKGEGSVTPVNVDQYGELRFYDKSVLVISGAEITGVTFYDNGGSKSDCNIMIAGESHTFNNKIIVWKGSMSPFVCTATKQIRMNSIDVTVKPAVPTSIDNPREKPSFREVFDMGGRRVSHHRLMRRGTYLVRDGQKAQTIIVK